MADTLCAANIQIDNDIEINFITTKFILIGQLTRQMSYCNFPSPRMCVCVCVHTHQHQYANHNSHASTKRQTNTFGPFGVITCDLLKWNASKRHGNVSIFVKHISNLFGMVIYGLH